MKISIITPIYKGNKYLNDYLKMIKKAILKFQEIEVIWVNDSPEIPLKYDKKLAEGIKISIIQNKSNVGIHRSRVIGLNKAQGEYILFLDQDDEIMEETLITQYNEVQGNDIIVGNGYYEDKNGEHIIYANKYSQDFTKKKNSYIFIRDFIISPGQCLIKRDSIPEYWTNFILKNSGTDDYLLWLLMFNSNCKIKCNYNTIYKHKYTGENLSLMEDKMYKSQIELIQLLENNVVYNRKDLKRLKRTIAYKHNYKKHFFRETIKNIDIFIYNLIYRIQWKGYRIS